MLKAFRELHWQQDVERYAMYSKNEKKVKTERMRQFYQKIKNRIREDYPNQKKTFDKIDAENQES